MRAAIDAALGLRRTAHTVRTGPKFKPAHVERDAAEFRRLMNLAIWHLQFSRRLAPITERTAA